MTNLPHTYPCAKLEKMVSEKKRRREEKAEAQASHNLERPRKGWNESPFSTFSLSMARAQGRGQWTHSSIEIEK